MSNTAIIGTLGSNIERRTYEGGACVVEMRAKGDAKVPIIRGYAAVYNKRSQNLGTDANPIFEVIEPGAFEDAINGDVRALFNHDENHVLARSKGGKGTLELTDDETGLGYAFEPPATQTGSDLQESMKRGDIAESSFAFSLKPGGDSWAAEPGEGGKPAAMIRTIKRGGVAKLYDVSPVTYPAYLDTDAGVAKRSLEEFRKATGNPVPPSENPSQPPLDLWEKRLASIKR